MQQAIRDAKDMLRRLRDAFEELHGDPANPDSRRALDMIATLSEWEEEHGADVLEAAADWHDEKLHGKK